MEISKAQLQSYAQEMAAQISDDTNKLVDAEKKIDEDSETQQSQ